MNHFKFLPLLGRILIGVPFAMSGLVKLMSYAATVSYIEAFGLPVPQLAYIVAVLIELVGGLMLLTGFRVRIVSLVMAVYCLVAAAFFHHDFANQNQMIHFLKNVMMAGGILQMTYFGAGAFSLDALAKRAIVRRASVSAS